MTEYSRYQRQVIERGMTRRHLLQRSVALSGGTLAATAFARGGRSFQVSAQEEPASEFTRDASIVSWGFGTEETNPMAFSRVNAFRDEFPNIEIEFAGLDDQKLLTAVASGNLPDLLWIDRFALTTWAARDVLMPLDDFISESGLDMSQFYDAALDEVTYDGQVYGIPQFMDVRALYVNRDALAEINLDADDIDTSDWDQLNEIGSELVQRDGDRITRWGFDNKLQAGHLYLWGHGNGGNFVSEDGSEITFDDPQIVEALEWGVQTYEMQGGFQDYETFATTFQGDEQFARGQVAMSVYEHWLLGIIGRVAPDLNFSVLPIRERGGDRFVSYTGGPAWCIPSGAPDPEAAWQFIEFMTRESTWLIGATSEKQVRQDDNQIYRPTLSASIPVDQLQIEEVYEPVNETFDEAVQLFPQILEQAFTRPVAKSPVGAEIHDILQDRAVMPALRGETPPAEGLAEADQRAEAAVAEFES